MSLQALLLERITTGLKRKALHKVSDWAETYRVMGQPYPGLWSHKYHPWTRDIQDSQAIFNVGQKAAQMGFTECGLNITFANIDLYQRSVLYILPNSTPDATDFSASRFDPAIELSEHLAKIFTNVKNVGHKRAGSANLFIRGSRSKAGLKSNPCGIVQFDEVDEMTQENIPLAYERASGQSFKQFWHWSTPTIDNFGINKLFVPTTQEHFCFKCPSCSRFTEWDSLDQLVVNEKEPDLSYLICKLCKNVLPHESKPEYLATGIWVPQFEGRDHRGWWAPQLYSPTVNPGDIARTILKARYDPAEKQELYNSKMGLPHVEEGARVNDNQINSCINNYTKGSHNIANKNRPIMTLGVDVGSWLHYEVNEWHLTNGYCPDINMLSIPKLIDEGKVEHFTDLDKLMKEYQILYCVIDANPERRKAEEFANRFFGHVSLCFYPRGIENRKSTIKTDDNQIKVDRTSWMDLALSRFGLQRIMLPNNLSEEYRERIKIPAKIYVKVDEHEKQKTGDRVAKYVGEGDHFAHTRVYNEVALPLAATILTNNNISSFL